MHIIMVMLTLNTGSSTLIILSVSTTRGIHNIIVHVGRYCFTNIYTEYLIEIRHAMKTVSTISPKVTGNTM